MFWVFKLTLAILLIAGIFRLTAWLFRQVRKPSGPLGRRVVRAMNLGHSTMTDWGLQQVTMPRNATILDVGCGGGRTVQKLADFAPEGKIVGLDYSAASVAVSRNTNADTIAAGRVHIEEGSVAALPFPDGTFDVVTAVETHYYWPDLPANVREILRVLKPRHVGVNRRNLSWRAVTIPLRQGHAAAWGRVLERRRAPRPADASGIHGRVDQTRLRKKLDLCNVTQARIAFFRWAGYYQRPE